jgi:hypothetical protein
MFKVIRSIAVTVAVVATMHIACASAKKPVFYPYELKHMKGKSVDTAEQSCFKYNYDVFGKSLRAFGQIINTMESSFPLGGKRFFYVSFFPIAAVMPCNRLESTT